MTLLVMEVQVLKRILRMGYRPNIMIIGPQDASDAVLGGLQPLFDGPIETRQFPGPLRLPAGVCAALVLRNVAAMGSGQQHQLMEWLDRAPGVPVLSLNASSLFDLVEKGMFSQRLYYRLNTVLENAEPAINVIN